MRLCSVLMDAVVVVVVVVVHRRYIPYYNHKRKSMVYRVLRWVIAFLLLIFVGHRLRALRQRLQRSRISRS